MDDATIEITAISQLGIDLSDRKVVYRCTSSDGAHDISVPWTLLPRLISLSVHAVGRIELENGERLVAIAPEGWALCAMPDGMTGIQFVLPGGAPLTFAMATEDFRMLCVRLADHLHMIPVGDRTSRPQ